MPNQLKIDPTRTTTLRNTFIADMVRRFKLVSAAIVQAIVEADALGLIPAEQLQLNVDLQAWRFQTDAQKVGSFRNWLQGEIDNNILTVEGLGDPWTNKYVESTYKKGVVRAYTDTRRTELAFRSDVFDQSKAQFLSSTFSASETISKLELIYSRTFNELQGVTAVMNQQLSRELASGLASGFSPRTIARNMTNNITKLTNTRAKVIARTEIIHAHAEGQLDTFERLGVKKLGLMAEWSTAGDERVCALCGELEGVVMTVKEARGLLPRHPNCRCSWIPANLNRREPGQLWGRSKDLAIEKSIQKEAGKNILGRAPSEIRRRSVWRGKDVRKTQVRSITGVKRAKDQESFRKVLTKKEKIAIKDWKTDSWRYVQEKYREDNFIGTAKYFQKALAKAPIHKGTFYRGGVVSAKDDVAGSLLGKFKIGKTLDFQAPISATKNVNAAGSFAVSKPVEKGAKRYILKFEKGNAFDISDIHTLRNFKFQQEVIIPPGSKWEIIKVVKKKGTFKNVFGSPSGTAIKDMIDVTEDYYEIIVRPVKAVKGTPSRGVIKGAFNDVKSKNLKVLFNQEVDFLMEDWGNKLKSLHSIEIIDGKTYAKKFGKTSLGNAGKPIDKVKKITFNGDIFDSKKFNLSSSLKELKNQGILVSSNPEHIVTHEFAHIIFGDLSKAKQNKIFDIWFKEINKVSNTISKSISSYAETSHGELFAESFVQWQSGKASKLAKLVMKEAGL